MKLGGAEQIPKPALKPFEPRREPPPQQGTPQQVAAGRTLFNTWCAECHTLGVTSVTPDLTRLNRGIVSGEVFKAIILKGALMPLGMARFNDVLTEADADALHAFLVDRSWQEYNQEQKKVLQSPH
jgi:quinohemoprotein ethanol dehydrogenase